MKNESSRPIRADAARNSERILRAARESFAASGPGARLEEIAERAGVGIATLYRRFPDREELVRAAIAQIMDEMVAPATAQALDDEDPQRGLTTLLNTAMSVAARERNTLAATKDIRAVNAEATDRFFEALTELMRRSQEAGLVRPDLTPADLYTIVGMLIGALSTTDPDTDGWRRYVVFILDAMSPEGASPLPPAGRLVDRPDHWPVPADD